jgi:hypothetical protein
MSGFLGWLIVAGLAVAIASIFMLASQLRRHMRDTTEMMVRSNEMLLARLDRLANPSPTPPSEPTVGVLLEKRQAQRRDPLRSMDVPTGSMKAQDLPRRRLNDLLST